MTAGPPPGGRRGGGEWPGRRRLTRLRAGRNNRRTTFAVPPGVRMLASRSIRISAVLGAATVAGLSVGAASAEACQTNPPPGHPCAGAGTIPAADVQYREAGAATWTDAGAFHVLKDEPAGG